jgi:O-6-methylguanine DNA methyltransferase
MEKAMTKKDKQSVETYLNHCTDFQRRVYRIILKIPAGQTRSYGWVARQMGWPGAARAVGGALNRNQMSPVIPCHRVVKSDGRLGGFAGGPARKMRLLQAEGWNKLPR